MVKRKPAPQRDLFLQDVKATTLRQRLEANGFLGNAQVMARADELLSWQTDAQITDLYERFRHNPMVRWRQSIRRVVGPEVPTEKGIGRLQTLQPQEGTKTPHSRARQTASKPFRQCRQEARDASMSIEEALDRLSSDNYSST